MKHLFLRYCLFVASTITIGQEITPQLDHIALQVNDLNQSVIFYSKVLNLSEMDTPVDNPLIRWMSFGNSQQLHLIEGKTPDLNSYKAVHFAVNVSDLNAFISKLKINSIPYTDWPGKPMSVSERGDGVQQIYIQDPSGYWIEVNDASY